MSLFTVVTKNDNYQLPATKLVVGLGNPGRKYANTRHNAGYLGVEHFIETYDLKPLGEKPQLKCRLSENLMEDTKVIIAEPLTFMNKSGQAVFALQEYFETAVDHILIVHDDIDIEFGKVRARYGGGTGGHNGLKSVSAAIGEEYARLRIGVSNKRRGKTDASDFVLKNFSRAELKKLPELWPTVNEYIMKFIDGNFKPDSKKLENGK